MAEPTANAAGYFPCGIMADLIFKVQKHGCGKDSPCAVCGTVFQQHGASVVMFDADGDNLGVICLDCLRAGPSGAAKRARAHAQKKSGEARRLLLVLASDLERAVAFPSMGPINEGEADRSSESANS